MEDKYLVLKIDMDCYDAIIYGIEVVGRYKTEKGANYHVSEHKIKSVNSYKDFEKYTKGFGEGVTPWDIKTYSYQHWEAWKKEHLKHGFCNDTPEQFFDNVKATRPGQGWAYALEGFNPPDIIKGDDLYVLPI